MKILPTPRPPPRRVPRRRPTEARDDDEGPAGCGWFDSSHALQQGLQVREVQAPGELSAEVPPGWWLRWALDER